MSKILIIEDDPMVAFINRRYLERLGLMEVYGPVTTRQEAFEQLEKEKIDLVLLDLFLPTMNGLELLIEMRTAQYFMDVIMITATNTEQEIKKAYAYGVIDYLIKPFEFSRFEIAINKHLKRQEALPNKLILSQADLDYEMQQISSPERLLPKGLNERTLNKIIAFLREESHQVWTLRVLAQRLGMSNVTIKKYMDFLELNHQVVVEMTSGQIGRPEIQYKFIEDYNY